MIDAQTAGATPEDLKFLNAEILKDGKTATKWAEPADKHVQSWVQSLDRTWTAEQAWGFEEVDGKRHYTRRVVVKDGDKTVRARLVYDYSPK